MPGEGNPDTEVVFVGEGPGFNEDREGRPFVGAAGGLLNELLESIGWRRDEVFITNVVKCRPPGNRDPEPDEIAACAPYLRRQLEVLDPALVVTLGRHSLCAFMPGARIGRPTARSRPADRRPARRDALEFAMYHPAAALRTPASKATSCDDMAASRRAAGARRRESRRRAAAAARRTVAPARSASRPIPTAPPARRPTDRSPDPARPPTIAHRPDPGRPRPDTTS